MKRQLGPILTVLVLLCAPAIWAQSGTTDPGQGSSTTDPTQTQSGSTDSSQTGSGDLGQSSSGPQETFSHPEQLPSLSALTEVTAHTGIKLDFSTGTVADYVTGNATGSNYWQNLNLFGGGISINQVRPTSLWSIGYNGGISVDNVAYAGGYNYTTLNQSAHARVIWEFAKRWQLRVKDSYLYSDDPFQPFLTYTSAPQPNDPDPVIYIPQAVYETNLGTVDLSYQLGEHDSINFTGSESFQRYLRGYSGLWNSTSYSGGGFYQHEFSPQLSAGSGYEFTALDFGHGQERAGINMIEFFVTYKFSPRLSVSAWIGPELTNTKDIIPVFCTPYGCFYEIQHASSLDLAEGATVAWSGSKQGFRAQYSHRVTNGGGILGAVSYYSATAGYVRSLNRDWALNVGVGYGNSLSISEFQANQYLDSLQGVVSFGRKIGDAWNASVYYAVINQKQNYYQVPGTLTTNGVGVTVHYVWGHSLGR
jgi:hypothetical protein